MTSGAGRDRRAASSSAAARAARIIARPPDAWTLTIQTPSRVAAATAPATVFGMSWNFRSRNTRSPRERELLDERRSLAGEQAAADLEAADGAAQPIGQRARLGDRVHVQSDEKLFHVCLAGLSSAYASARGAFRSAG